MAIPIAVEHRCCIEARFIVLFCGLWIVIAIILNGASADFFNITNAIFVEIEDAVTLTVVTFCGICALGFVGCICIVVACCFVGTSLDFKLIADAVSIGVSDALAVAVISIGGIGA